MRKISFLLVVLFCSYVSMAQEQNQLKYKPTIGASAKVSTTGFGADIYWSPIKNWAVKLGYDTFTFKYDFDYNSSDIKLQASAKAKTGNLGLSVGYQFLSWMYATVGVGTLNFRPEVQAYPSEGIKYGDIILSPETVGSLSFKVKPSAPVCPYLGIGFGRYIANRAVGFGFEVGTWYMGRPKLEVQASGMLSPSANPEHVSMLEDELRDLRFYPVLKFNVNVKLFTHKPIFK